MHLSPSSLVWLGFHLSLYLSSMWCHGTVVPEPHSSAGTRSPGCPCGAHCVGVWCAAPSLPAQEASLDGAHRQALFCCLFLTLPFHCSSRFKKVAQARFSPLQQDFSECLAPSHVLRGQRALLQGAFLSAPSTGTSGRLFWLCTLERPTVSVLAVGASPFLLCCAPGRGPCRVAARAGVEASAWSESPGAGSGNVQRAWLWAVHRENEKFCLLSPFWFFV